MTQPANKRQSTTDMPSALAAKLERESKHGRVSQQEAFCLGMIWMYLKTNPDGRFAELLIEMLQGNQG